MKLNNSHGHSFELNIVGYQFPDLEDEPYDSNWLNVEVRAENHEGVWSKVDPCLLTYEALFLADWLTSIAIGLETQSRIEFTEPNIWFETQGTNLDDKILRVYFELECRPEWLPAKQVYGDPPLSIEFLISEVNLVEAATSLQKQLEKFPQRTDR